MFISKLKLILFSFFTAYTGFYAGANMSGIFSSQSNQNISKVYYKSGMYPVALASLPDTIKQDTNVIIAPDMNCLQTLGINQYWFIMKDNTSNKNFALLKFDADFNLHTQLTQEDINTIMNYLVMLKK